MLCRPCIYFLLFMCSLCYSYIFEEKHFRPRRFEEGKTKKLHHHKEKPKQISQYDKGRYLGYSAYDDKEPVAQINLAKFIQKPNIRPERLQHTKNVGWAAYQDSIQDNMISYSAMDQEITKRKLERSKHGLKSKDDYPSKMTDFRSPQHEASFRIDSKGPINKKSIMTRLRKIPFFFHNTSDTVKVKGKNKKRKLFNFHRTPAKTQLTSTGLYTTEVMMNLLKVQKRSSNEQFCPMCQRPFVSEDNIRDKRFYNIIHNCRQYYLKQKTDPKLVTNSVTKIYNNMFTADLKAKENLQESYYENRNKRYDVLDSHLARELEELNDFERKLDGKELYGTPRHDNR